MKYIFPCMLLLVALLPSCSTDLDINAPYQDVTIVYGLLDPQVDTQYIRIEKGFIDKSKSALTLAKIPDSLYYGNILRVQLVSKAGDTDLLNQTTLTKDTGTFASGPYVLYYTTKKLDPTLTYTLIVTNKSSGKVITAQTPIVQSFEVGSPSSDTSFHLSLVDIAPDTSQIYLKINWYGAANGRTYDLDMRFSYLEWDVSNPSQKETKTVDWQIFTNYVATSTAVGSPQTYSVPANQFYSFLAGAITKDPNKQRMALSKPCQFVFTVGGEALYDYVLTSQAQLGLTALQAQVKYTNISNGLGIFSSRTNESVDNVGLSTASLDSLACGSVTKALNFHVAGSCNP